MKTTYSKCRQTF